jgi:hypothetical protein
MLSRPIRSMKATFEAVRRSAMRLETAYYLTQAFALKAGYTGMYVGNIKRAATSVKYYLPDMGYRNSGNQELISNGVDLGIDSSTSAHPARKASGPCRRERFPLGNRLTRQF